MIGRQYKSCYDLRVIGLRSEIGIEDPGAMRRVAAPVPGFGSDVNRIDLCENLRVIELERPALLVRVVVVQDTEAKGRLLATGLLTPQMEGDVLLRMLCG